jgi:hypothetical protein
VRWRRRTGRVVRWAGNGSGKDDGGAVRWLRWKGGSGGFRGMTPLSSFTHRHVVSDTGSMDTFCSIILDCR